jgi:predicted phosphatase
VYVFIFYIYHLNFYQGGSPFTVIDNSNLKDASGTKVRLLGIASDVLMELKTNNKWKDTKVAWYHHHHYH